MLLFYGSQFNMSDLPLPKTQNWAIFHEESPRNEALFLYKRTYDVFDIAATFSRFSDFPLTFQYLENVHIITDTQYYLPVEEKNKLLKDIAPVLYIQSDCDTPNKRDSYVKELMKYIQIDSYGSCLNNRAFPEEVSKIYSLDLYNEKLLQFVGKYKFVIAFENAVCEDYITEKLWRPLMTGSVPIYLGSPSIEDWLPNSKSAILAKDFSNISSLADHIKTVNLDNKLYNQFLDHKRGVITNERLKNILGKGNFGLDTHLDNTIPAFECHVCDRIQKDIQTRKRQHVYDCVKPLANSGWEYHWRFGDCKSKKLVSLVKNHSKDDNIKCD